jgi:hypothetical protein
MRIGRETGTRAHPPVPEPQGYFDIRDGTILSLLSAWSVREKNDNIHGGDMAAHIAEVGVILGTKPTREGMQLLRQAEHSCVW